MGSNKTVKKQAIYQVSQSKEEKIKCVGKDAEHLELLCPVGGNVKWYSYY